MSGQAARLAIMASYPPITTSNSSKVRIARHSAFDFYKLIISEHARKKAVLEPSLRHRSRQEIGTLLGLLSYKIERICAANVSSPPPGMPGTYLEQVAIARSELRRLYQDDKPEDVCRVFFDLFEYQPAPFLGGDADSTTVGTDNEDALMLDILDAERGAERKQTRSRKPELVREVMSLMREKRAGGRQRRRITACA